ncbi:MAG: amidohydrolase [Deltaproteobacteria bacterium]|nr:amidohydrolase [Deltaproteobacteria bacterium]
MLIDGHIHISDKTTGVWNHPPFTAEELVRLMDGPFPILGAGRRVDRAVVQPHSGETLRADQSFGEQHGYVTEVVKKYPDRLVGCFHINPHLGVEAALKELKRLVQEGGYRAVKLNPSLHGYMPPRSRALLDPIFETAAKLRLPIIVHMGDTPFAVPVLMAPLAEAHPQTKIILAHLGTQKVSYADEAIYVARKNENIWLETGWGPLPRIKEAVQAVGAGRLIFGSDCPIQEMGSQLRPIEVLAWKPPVGMNLPEADVERIMGDNMADLLKAAEPTRNG